jgi:hypothetical protein
MLTAVEGTPARSREYGGPPAASGAVCACECQEVIKHPAVAECKSQKSTPLDKQAGLQSPVQHNNLSRRKSHARLCAHPLPNRAAHKKVSCLSHDTKHFPPAVHSNYPPPLQQL